MRAPSFWWDRTPGLAARALAPAGWLWGALTAHRMKRAGYEPSLPVICVGNFVAGGAGKTPAAIAIVRLLQAEGLRPAFLTRGYGGTLSRADAPFVVDLQRHTAAQAGDEPMLLARVAPAIVCPDRINGAEHAVRTGADVLIMDDGLQNPSLIKRVRIAVVDLETGAGNGLCIPAGPLRAPLDAQMRHTDAVLIAGNRQAGTENAGKPASQPGDWVGGRAQAHGKAMFRAFIAPDETVVQDLAGTPVVAFAGIGRPEKFFATLEAAGADIREAFAFADHHRLEEAEVQTLLASAKTHAARLVTTEKDHVRIAGDFPAGTLHVLPIRLRFEDTARVRGFLLEALGRDRDGRSP